MQSQCAFHTTHLRGVNPFVAPLESNKSIEGFDLLSIRIPKIEKTSILYRLYLLGIHEASIFPGFTGIAASAAGVAKVLFVVFLVLAVGSLLWGASRR